MTAPWIVAAVILAAIAIAEAILRWKWHPTYLTVGLPLFRWRVHRPRGLDDVSLETLETKSRTAAASPLQFRRVAPDSIVFREKPFGGSIHYFPLMHGLIRFRREEGSVVVLGLVNWFWLAFLIALIALTGRDFRHMALYIFGALGILYFIQAVRFGRVANGLKGEAA